MRQTFFRKGVGTIMIGVLVACGFTCRAAEMPRNASPSGKAQTQALPTIQLKPGTIESFTAAGTTETTYHVYTPGACQTNRPVPMLVLFSPGGDGRGMVSAFKDAAEAAGWIVAGCDKLSNSFEGNPQERQVEKELLDDILARIPHAPDKLFLGGFSGGAQRAYHLTARRKEKVAGVFAMGGWLGGETFYRLPYDQRMAVAMVNGKDDAAANSWVTKDTAILKKRFCIIRTFSFAGGHAMPPRATQDEVLAWLAKPSGGATTGRLAPR